MKIGIISRYDSLMHWDNYGTLFQNYALQTFLQQYGHETFWIRTKTTNSKSSSQQNKNNLKLKYTIKYAVHKTKNILKRHFKTKPFKKQISSFNQAHPRFFNEFFLEHIPHTKNIYSEDELIQDPPLADCYVAGSDQIWTHANDLTFLGFGRTNTKRIAYAVSAPWNGLSQDWLYYAKKNIKRFDSVSVREAEGLQVCSHIGYSDVKHVLDPTLLLEKKHYIDLITDKEKIKTNNTHFTLCYLLNINSLKQIPLSGIKLFANEKKTNLMIIPLQGSEIIIPEKYIYTPSPVEWLNTFYNASYIITNSFHGAIFSIIMQKPFLILLQHGKTSLENCRFSSFLKELELDNRIINEKAIEKITDDDIKKIIDKKIDWPNVEYRLKHLKTISTDFLLTAIPSLTFKNNQN